MHNGKMRSHNLVYEWVTETNSLELTARATITTRVPYKAIQETKLRIQGGTETKRVHSEPPQ